jgi:hypothetical protein
MKHKSHKTFAGQQPLETPYNQDTGLYKIKPSANSDKEMET